MKNDHTPEIRFPTFNDVWTQRTLNSVADRLKSYSLSRDVETKEFTGYKYIHYGDIHTKVAEIVDKNTNLPNIKPGKYELLEKGDLVLADASEDYQGIAAPAVITENVSYKLVAGLHTIALRPKSIDSLFLYYLLNSPTFKRYGYKTGTGMKVFGISVTNLMKFESMFPLLEEQIKIGDFLRKIDKTIDLHQQELDTLKQTKQGFLQKMFTKEGVSIPEIRFNGFMGDWDEQTLEKVLKINSGRDYKHLKKGNIPVYGTGGYMLSVNDKLSDEDAIGIGRKGTINKPQLLKAPFWTVDTLFFMTTQEKNDVYFCYTLANKINWKKYDESTGVPSLSKASIGKIPVSIPPYEEQIQIGKFFKQLDELIALQQQELDALKQTKKAFLQKMFV